MKELLKTLQRGRRLQVSVVEVQNNQQILVSSEGELFRFTNSSGRSFAIGEQIMLVVTQINPLQFSLAGDQRLFSRLV